MRMVKLRMTGMKLKVYDGDGLEPDLSEIQAACHLLFYLHAWSVWRKAKVICPVQLHELFGM